MQMFVEGKSAYPDMELWNGRDESPYDVAILRAFADLGRSIAMSSIYGKAAPASPRNPEYISGWKAQGLTAPPSVLHIELDTPIVAVWDGRRVEVGARVARFNAGGGSDTNPLAVPWRPGERL